jgi:hypothetical protein
MTERESKRAKTNLAKPDCGYISMNFEFQKTIILDLDISHSPWFSELQLSTDFKRNYKNKKSRFIQLKKATMKNCVQHRVHQTNKISTVHIIPYGCIVSSKFLFISQFRQISQFDINVKSTFFFVFVLISSMLFTFIYKSSWDLRTHSLSTIISTNSHFPIQKKTHRIIN